MRRICVIILLILMVAANSGWAADIPSNFKNVKNFGAIGDGIADDTAAIRKAITKAGAGGTVYFPYGRYIISGTLKLQQVALLGAIDGGWPADKSFLPVILIKHKNGPAVDAGEAASIRGLQFTSKNDTENPEPRPATILLTGTGVTISNVKIECAWDAIASSGKDGNGRCCLENIFIVFAFHRGVYLTRTADTPVIKSVEIWNPGLYCRKNAIGFEFGRNDQFRMSLCFVFRAKIGFLFGTSPSAKDPTKDYSYGDMVGCSTDSCINGVDIKAGNVRKRGCNFANHFASLLVSGSNAQVQMSGCGLSSNGEPHIICEDCGSLAVSGCTFSRNSDKYFPAVELHGGKNIAITGCIFDKGTGGFLIDGKTDYFAITGNVFAQSKRKKIVDNTPSGRHKAIANNVQ